MFTVERIGANKGSVAGGRRPTLHILPFFTECFFRLFPPNSQKRTKAEKYDLQEKTEKKDRNGRKRMEKNIFIYISSCYGKDDGSILSYTEISACY